MSRFGYSSRQQIKMVTRNTFDDIQDLQLAAELGRNLLERNQELENELKQQQAIIDDQAQEIEFLTKQSSSMKEESATRAKFYEQLESSIYELERTNSQLSRKHEIDKKRIQSLCENIEFLERKCEEMTGTLETIRDQNKKSYGGANKMSRSSYFNFGSGTSDEEIHAGFTLFRRRTHSLHDLRDYTSSPDDFDSNNSNSPDLKTSESEFIETLESRIEELLSAKRKESEKIQQLESQIRILIQENANLQQQLSEVTSEKDEEISELRKQLLDSSSYTHNQLQLPHLNESLLSSTTLPFKTSSRRNSNLYNSYLETTSASGSLSNPSLRSFVSLCKRCSTEINLLNLVNSIEVEHDSENYENFLSYDNDDDLEFSSLEHELARATGNAFDNHNHSHNHLHHNLLQHNSYHHHHHNHHHYPSAHHHEPNCTEMESASSSSNDDKDEVGVEAKENPDDIICNKASCSSDEDEDDEHEDPCLLKDRKPEFVVKSKNKSKNKQKILCSSSSIKLKKFKSSSSDSCCGSSTSSGCSSAAATYSSAGTGHCTDTSRQSSPVVVVTKNIKNSKLLELPVRIPTDDEDEEDEDERHNSIITVDTNYTSTATLGIKNLKGCDINRPDEIDGANKVGAEDSNQGVLDETSQETDKEQTKALNKRSKLFETQESTSSSSGYDSETSFTKSGSSVLSSSSSSASFTRSLSTDDNESSDPFPSASSSPSSIVVPEYKQILQNMFSLFNNSKRKYPIPMYPFIQEARRQSSALTQ